MNILWYYHRLKKMSLSEVFKRVFEYGYIYRTKVKYRKTENWPYNRFAEKSSGLVFRELPKKQIKLDWRNYNIYNLKFDLTNPIDWYFTENKDSFWPKIFYSDINYRPGNPYGDIRINWELNRLQFFPLIATENEELAKDILQSWLKNSPYLYGPSYVSSMEVALRWISVYWGVCLLSEPIDDDLLKEITGLGVASGIFIENRLSTHSSAGNHIIVEAVGLFWIAKALRADKYTEKWAELARQLIWDQTLRQLNPDGSPKEQSFWYLGFVVDALFYYLLLEDISLVPSNVLKRLEKSLEFISEIVLHDGTFPDFGDRDDGYVGHINDDYERSPFVDLLKIGAMLFNRPEWVEGRSNISNKFHFFDTPEFAVINQDNKHNIQVDNNSVKLYPDCGMTVMQKGKGQLIFRHAPLGLEPTYGHGHADALSILFSWGGQQILCDLGSGQYNGDQNIRNYFRSTLAHNTIQVDNCDQARILGPFMWEGSYNCITGERHAPENNTIEYKHDAYFENYGITHTRTIEWAEPNKIIITDFLDGPKEKEFCGTFHFTPDSKIEIVNNVLEINSNDVKLNIYFDSKLKLELSEGSVEPLLGWKSAVYGRWEPIHLIRFSSEIRHIKQFETILETLE